MLISILAIIFSNLDIPTADAKKFSKFKSNNSKSDFKKSKSKISKSDFKKSKSKISNSDFKKYDNNIKRDKKFKPNSISQGSYFSSFESKNMKNLDMDKVRNLGDKDKRNIFPEISQLPYFPECGNQGTCIDKDEINIEDEINIDVDNVDVDWDDIDFDDIDWDDIDVDIDDDIDDEDVDIVVREDDDDDENITYIYNEYPEGDTYQESYVNEYDENYIQQDTSPQQSYVKSEIQRIVTEGSFKIHLVEPGKPLTPIGNTGYVLLGINQGTNNDLEISSGSNGQIIILTGDDDNRAVKISGTGNIKLELNEVILGTDDALILVYLDESSSWVQVASKIA
ncbi:MAG: hypothetical protein AB7P56_06085 [Nitrososphaeraceae archaeon]